MKKMAEVGSVKDLKGSGYQCSLVSNPDLYWLMIIQMKELILVGLMCCMTKVVIKSGTLEPTLQKKVFTFCREQ